MNLVFLYYLIVLLFSVMIHEVAHGAMAYRLGDPTAKNAGRLTLNPLKHLDFFGSFLLPVMLYLLSGGSMILGWAKPVPYNPLKLKNPKTGAGLIGLAGPVSNVTIAIIFGLFSRFLAAGAEGSEVLIALLNIIVHLNVLLAVFNLVPLPPLDGSNILFALIPESWTEVRYFLARYGFYLLIFFIFFGFRLLIPLISLIDQLILGPAAIF